MQPGQRRALKMLMPDLDGVQLVETTLTAKDVEPTELLSGPHELLRIETVTHLADGQEIAGTLWCDRTGDVLKSYSAAMAMETYRATKAAALEKGRRGGTRSPTEHDDQGRRSRCLTPIGRSRCATASIWTGAIRPPRLSPGPRRPSSRSTPTRPRSRSTPSGRAETGTGPRSKRGQSPFPRAIPAATRTPRPIRPATTTCGPNNLIQSDDPLIIADAKKVAGDEKDPWRVAVALERFVSREMTNQGYRQAFATASEAARNHEGDCKEHAVLLAALCRAAASPPASPSVWSTSRGGRRSCTTCGPRSTSKGGGCRWTPRWANGGIGAAHLKLGQSNLKTASALSALLPIMRVAGRLKIEIVDAQ